MISATHILIVALVIFLLFGANRLADIGKGLGEGIKNFKKGLADEPSPDQRKAAAPQLETRDPEKPGAKGDEGGTDKGA